MKKVLYLFVGLFVLGLFGARQPDASPKAAASVAAAPCVVGKEKYFDMKEGMSRFQIERDIGCPGEQLSSNSFGKIQTVMLSWKGNGSLSSVNATFQNDTLVSKSQFGLR
jgi:hypothetical protein